jgi:hypothetical protein
MENWYTKDAVEASAKLGEKGRDLVLAQMRKVLAGGMQTKRDPPTTTIAE